MFWWRIGGALAVVITGLGLMTWFGTAASVPVAANGNGDKTFGISDIPGRASALYPGATGSRGIRLSNPENFTILVQTVTATVGKPTDAKGKPVTACPATSVRVDALLAPVAVPGNGTADLTLVTHMLAGAPDACRNLTFPLTYTGTAVKR
jgi:hypothetical protein